MSEERKKEQSLIKSKIRGIRMSEMTNRYIDKVLDAYEKGEEVPNETIENVLLTYQLMRMVSKIANSEE